MSKFRARITGVVIFVSSVAVVTSVTDLKPEYVAFCFICAAVAQMYGEHVFGGGDD